MVSREPPEICWENTLGAPNGVPFDEDTKELLKNCINIKMPRPIHLNDFLKRSEDFPISFPINTVRCCSLKDRGIPLEVLEVTFFT